jgi:hypothetical protein
LCAGEIDVLKLPLHRGLHRPAIVIAERGECFSEALAREVIGGDFAETQQIFGGVVFAEIRSHAVDAAVIHQVGTLKRRFAVRDILRRHDERAVRGRESIRLRGRRPIRDKRRPGEKRKSNDRNAEKRPFQYGTYPVFLHALQDRRVCIHQGSPFSNTSWRHSPTRVIKINAFRASEIFRFRFRRANPA